MGPLLRSSAEHVCAAVGPQALLPLQVKEKPSVSLLECIARRNNLQV